MKENKHSPMTTADIIAALKEACENDTDVLDRSEIPEEFYDTEGYGTSEDYDIAEDDEAVESNQAAEDYDTAEDDEAADNHTPKRRGILDILYYIAESEILATEEFRHQLEPLDDRLVDLLDRMGVDRNVASDFEDLVAAFNTAYEKHSFIKGVKTGMKLMMELEEK